MKGKKKFENLKLMLIMMKKNSQFFTCIFGGWWPHLSPAAAVRGRPSSEEKSVRIRWRVYNILLLYSMNYDECDFMCIYVAKKSTYVGDSDRRRACVCASVCVASVHARVMSKWWLHKKLNLRRRRRRGPFISPGERVLSPPPSLPPTGRSRDNNNSVLRTSLEKRTVFAIYSVNNRFRREFCSSQFFFSFLSIFHVLKTHLVYFRYVSFRIINYDYVIDRS